jgi:hypothetical protein
LPAGHPIATVQIRRSSNDGCRMQLRLRETLNLG